MDHKQPINTISRNPTRSNSGDLQQLSDWLCTDASDKYASLIRPVPTIRTSNLNASFNELDILPDSNKL